MMDGKARTVEPEETPIAREWLCIHVSMTTESGDHSNSRSTAGGSVLCWVHAEAMTHKI
jgi:hypothetical protein